MASLFYDCFFARTSCPKGKAVPTSQMIHLCGWIHHFLLFLMALSRRSVLSSLGALGVSSSATVVSRQASAMNKNSIRILLHGGDNMMGRAVQLTFPVQAPGEEWIKDSCTAWHYLTLALHGDGGSTIHGEPTAAQELLDEIRLENQNHGHYLWSKAQVPLAKPPDLCLLNLETAVTRSIKNPDIPLVKGINYHMHVDNFESIFKGFPVDTPHIVVTLANNHGLDYGRQAFDQETLPLLTQSTSPVRVVGCGHNFGEAARPVVVDTKANDRVEVFAFAAGCSGTPYDWWATDQRSGIVGLPAIRKWEDVDEALYIIQRSLQLAPSSDARPLRIISIHWGPNWAMRGSEDKAQLEARQQLAHRLIDECGVDLIYGHSSHHIRGIEVYHNRLILYGAGDIINDYEGFENSGEEKYNRMGAVFVADFDPTTGEWQELYVVPMLMNQLRLERYIPNESNLWKPREKRYVQDPSQSRKLCDFVNQQSIVDAGAKGQALILEHLNEASKVILDGGPVLHAKWNAPPRSD